MKNCIICGSEVEYPSFDFCEECSNMSVEEIEGRYLEKWASATRQDQPEARSQEDPCKSPRPI